MTKLEQRVLKVLGLSNLDDLKSGDRKELQKKLDGLLEKVLCRISPYELVEHSKIVYNETINEYLNNPHTQFIIAELLDFIDMVPEDSPVLDIGCGHGRDVAFMRCGDADFRNSFINEPSWRDMPTKALNAVGVDISTSMVEAARTRLGKAMPKLKRIDLIETIKHADMHHDQSLESAFPNRKFKGIWSCTALFTHTPHSLLKSTMKLVNSKLASGGVLFISYTNGGVTERYDKLLISSTGRIKYFSQPKPEEIIEKAQFYGLKAIRQSFDDYVLKGEVVQKNLFASQFFKKE